LGGILHLRLNKHCRKPIAKKYRKGKLKRTLKRELKELEVVEREAVSLSTERQPRLLPLALLRCGGLQEEESGPN